jgi:hypothetical protein
MNGKNEQEPLRTPEHEPGNSQAASRPSAPGRRSESDPFDRAAENLPRAAIELRIDELVLTGVAPADRYAIGEAIELELARLFAEEGAPSWRRSLEVDYLNAGEVQLHAGAHPRSTGVQLAQAIYGGLEMKAVPEPGLSDSDYE